MRCKIERNEHEKMASLLTAFLHYGWTDGFIGMGNADVAILLAWRWWGCFAFAVKTVVLTIFLLRRATTEDIPLLLEAGLGFLLIYLSVCSSALIHP